MWKLTRLLACVMVTMAANCYANEGLIRRLEAKIQVLEQENADLRDQLRSRDSSKQPTPAIVQTSKITMQSIPNCTACEHWYATERPKLVAVGWTVDRETVTTWPVGRVFPRWRVCTGNACIEIENCSSNQFMARLRTWLSPSSDPLRNFRADEIDWLK